MLLDCTAAGHQPAGTLPVTAHPPIRRPTLCRDCHSRLQHSLLCTHGAGLGCEGWGHSKQEACSQPSTCLPGTMAAACMLETTTMAAAASGAQPRRGRRALDLGASSAPTHLGVAARGPLGLNGDAELGGAIRSRQDLSRGDQEWGTVDLSIGAAASRLCGPPSSA